jgi:hypothetical protein
MGWGVSETEEVIPKGTDVFVNPEGGRGFVVEIASI